MIDSLFCDGKPSYKYISVFNRMRIIITVFAAVALGQVALKWFVRIFATFNSLFCRIMSFVIPLIMICFMTPGIAQLSNKCLIAVQILSELLLFYFLSISKK